MDTGKSIFSSKTYTLRFANSPLDIQGLSIRLSEVRLPLPGLYVVECMMNELVVAHQTLLLKEPEDL